MNESTGEAAAALALIDKIRVFADGLESDERLMLAALLGPGIHAAWGDASAPGSLTAEWTRTALATHLQAAVRHRDLRPDRW